MLSGIDASRWLFLPIGCDLFLQPALDRWVRQQLGKLVDLFRRWRCLRGSSKTGFSQHKAQKHHDGTNTSTTDRHAYNSTSTTDQADREGEHGHWTRKSVSNSVRTTTDGLQMPKAMSTI